MKWDFSISGFALLTIGCENTRRENNIIQPVQKIYPCVNCSDSLEFKVALTSQPLHPRGLINSQIVDYNFHDAAKKLIEVF